MNEHTSPAFWPARGSLHEGRAFVLKEDVIFTVLAQEGGISPDERAASPVRRFVYYCHRGQR